MIVGDGANNRKRLNAIADNARDHRVDAGVERLGAVLVKEAVAQRRLARLLDKHLAVV